MRPSGGAVNRKNGPENERGGPPRPALSPCGVPQYRPVEVKITPLTGGIRNFFQGETDPLEGLRTVLEGGHQAWNPDALQVRVSVGVGAGHPHLAPEAVEPALAAQ